MMKPNKPRESALAGHLPEKQRYLRSFIAGKCVFKNKMIVSWIVLIYSVGRLKLKTKF